MKNNLLLAVILGLILTALPARADEAETLLGANVSPGIEAAACGVQVVVRDNGGASPPAGLVVQLTNQRTRRTASGELGEGGRASFPEFDCGKTHVAVGQIEGFPGAERLRVLGEATVLLDSVGAPVAELWLPPVTSIEVCSVDEFGSPVPGGQVWLTPRDGRGYRATANLASGRERLVVQRGVYELRHASWGSPEPILAEIDGEGRSLPTTFSADSPGMEVVLVMEAGHVVRGVIRDESGRGIEGVSIDILGVRDGESCSSCAVTDADGSFAATVRTGEILVPRSLDGKFVFSPESLRVAGGQIPAPVIFVASRNPQDVSRIFVVGPTNEPVPGAELTVRFRDADGEDRTWWRVSDDRGAIDVPCGDTVSLRVSVDPPSPFLRTSWVGSMECNSSTTIPLRRGGTVRGTVVAEDSDPVERLLLQIRHENGTTLHAKTDDDGAFSATGLLEGRHTVEVEDEQSGLAIIADNEGSPATFIIESERATPALDLRAVAAGEICVDLVDGSGEPLDVAALDVFATDGEAPVKVVRNRQSDPAKRLCAKAIPPGFYDVRIGRWNSAFRPFWWPGVTVRDDATKVRVAPGETTVLGPLAVEPTGTVVALMPKRSRGCSEAAEVAIAKAVREDSEDSPWIPLARDHVAIRSQGAEVWVRGVPVGTWRVRVAFPGGVCTSHHSGDVSVRKGAVTYVRF